MTKRVTIGLVCILAAVPLGEGYFFNSWYRRVTTFEENESCKTSTDPDKKYAIIIHGWRESCREEWAIDLLKNLEKYRGGCIMCMNYELAASIPHYLMLAHHVNFLAQVLKEKLEDLEDKGYDPNNGYIFGFSLGARIAIRAGTAYGHQKLAEIDACDMAGPGFDFFDTFDPTLAAQNVQCIHTSKDKGTLSRNCHQNWNMGVCGMYQLGASILPGRLKSHGFCPRFYNSAFEHDFYAEIIPEQCSLVEPVQQFWPNNFKMGYMENRKHKVQGQLYASTISTYPYTTNVHQVTAWEVLSQIKGRFIMVVNEPEHYIIYFRN